MKKFEIVKNSLEVSYKNQSRIIEGCTLDQDTQYPEKIKSFNSKEEALKELGNYSSSIDKLSGGAGTYYLVTEYYVEENEYNEDGEWIDGGTIWEYTKMPLTDYQMDAIASYMNDDIREQVHCELAPCTHKEFLDRYLELDPDFSELLENEFRLCL